MFDDNEAILFQHVGTHKNPVSGDLLMNTHKILRGQLFEIKLLFKDLLEVSNVNIASRLIFLCEKCKISAEEIRCVFDYI